MILILYITGAQDWHIVSLLGDVTSPTTVAHYVTMTSDLRVLITEKHCSRADSRRCTQTSVQSSPLNKQGGFVTSQQWMWAWRVSPQQHDLRTRALYARFWSTAVEQAVVCAPVFSEIFFISQTNVGKLQTRGLQPFEFVVQFTSII